MTAGLPGSVRKLQKYWKLKKNHALLFVETPDIGENQQKVRFFPTYIKVACEQKLQFSIFS